MKVCKNCEVEKPLSEYYVRKGNNNRPHSKCKECYRLQYEERVKSFSPEKQAKIAKHRETKMNLQEGKKECLKCETFKSVEEFMTKAGERKYAHCSACRPLLEKQYFEKNPEKHADRHITRPLNKILVSDYTLSLRESGCTDCGNYYPDAMEFDHTCAPSEKSIDISRIHAVGSSESVLKALKIELGKGEYVCVNCHRKRTAKRAKSARVKYLSGNYLPSSFNKLSLYMYEVLSKEACIDCEENHFLVLEFDHVRGSKIAELSQMVKKPSLFSLSCVIDEIAKCEVRCGNCHRQKTRARQLGMEQTEQLPKNNSFRYCKCGKNKELISIECLDCHLIAKSKEASDRYGDLETLITRLRASNFVQVAKEMEISDNAIRKHLRRNGIDPKTLLSYEVEDQ